MRFFNENAKIASRKIAIPDNSARILQVLQEARGTEECGLAGGEARDALLFFEGPFGDAGMDVFCPYMLQSQLNHFEKMIANRFFPESNRTIETDNLGMPFGGSSLAGYSYFHTPTASISKVLLLEHTRGNYVALGHQEAFDDLDDKLIRLDYSASIRPILLGEKIQLALQENELITGCEWDGEFAKVRICYFDGKNMNFDKYCVVPAKTKPVARYGAFSPVQLAKMIVLAVRYSKIGFNMDSITEEFLAQYSMTLDTVEREETARYVLYKLHFDELDTFRNFIAERQWASKILDTNWEVALKTTECVLSKYRHFRRVVLQQDDYFFDGRSLYD